MNTSINFHGFVDLYQEQNTQIDPGVKTTIGTPYHTASHHPGMLIDVEHEGEQLLEGSCWNRNHK